MTLPVRLRLSRARGFDLQAHSAATNGLPAVVVRHPTNKTNPFVVGENGTAAECVRFYTLLIAGLMPILARPSPGTLQATAATFRADWQELAGHNLACACALDQPCHADVLLEAVALREKAA